MTLVNKYRGLEAIVLIDPRVSNKRRVSIKCQGFEVHVLAFIRSFAVHLLSCDSINSSLKVLISEYLFELIHLFIYVNYLCPYSSSKNLLNSNLELSTRITQITRHSPTVNQICDAYVGCCMQNQ